MRISRKLHLEASVWVDKAFGDFQPFLSDPRSLRLWDKGVERVEIRTPGPLRAGSTFDTIGPPRGHRPGLRTSYRVAEIRRDLNVVEALDHPLFERAE
jgi:hypothetical protein